LASIPDSRFRFRPLTLILPVEPSAPTE